LAAVRPRATFSAPSDNQNETILSDTRAVFDIHVDHLARVIASFPNNLCVLRDHHTVLILY
jgi:hypothetical protein